MANAIESNVSGDSQPEGECSSRWLRLGVIAAASALAGGVAAAWWYRKTLTTLRQAEENSTNPQYGSSGDDASDEV
jgi:hypothetical protein